MGAVMLTSTVIRLRAKQSGWLPNAMGEYAHATFLSFINQVAPDFAQALHDANARQPYAFSPLIGGKRDRRGVKVWSGGEYWMRFTILDSALYTVFSQYFAESTSFDIELQLGKIKFVIEEIITSPRVERWGGYTTFSDILSDASFDPIVSLKFMSLTAFSVGRTSSGSRRFSIFPEPAIVFDSLLRRWNKFADQPLDNPAEWQKWVSENVVVRQYRTRSDLWKFKHHLQIGFVGDCTYEIKGNHRAETRKVNALADFAFYAGVGYKTTMGMGQCKRQGARGRGQGAWGSARGKGQGGNER